MIAQQAHKKSPKLIHSILPNAFHVEQAQKQPKVLLNVQRVEKVLCQQQKQDLVLMHA